MASTGPTAWWEAPQFSFDMPDQTQELKTFHTRVLDFLETLDMDPEKQDETKRGWNRSKCCLKERTGSHCRH